MSGPQYPNYPPQSYPASYPQPPYYSPSQQPQYAPQPSQPQPYQPQPYQPQPYQPQAYQPQPYPASSQPQYQSQPQAYRAQVDSYPGVGAAEPDYYQPHHPPVQPLLTRNTARLMFIVSAALMAIAVVLLVLYV
eukprot:CAMPEP_0204896802 /NCGR_PEP_ID=MMETSP1397-20131031/377_1 /ASSEMBLY_ACC=CAM_ASM_000891 /TAXON_ID=49980 /ORGANISM="Climacostomum Climacostomum virens, Strain Stock W-24" /LENGTH=133 /DNA_ID=CAMNT_0052064467 /DNA_START=63 /DNA_END=464 /DNA_ORIENTATION=-